MAPDFKTLIEAVDVIAKVVIAIIGGVWVWHTYPESKEKDFRTAYWDRQMSLFFEATQAAAQIATLSNEDERRSGAINKFWELYWGQMIVIETKNEEDPVAQAMMDFGKCLIEPGEQAPCDKCDINELKNRAWALGKACRDSIGTSWDQKLHYLSRPLANARR
jgi:hypothetical protein